MFSYILLDQDILTQYDNDISAAYRKFNADNAFLRFQIEFLE